MKNGVEDFVVESTPVLDLKKNSLSSVIPRAAPAGDANWDSDRTEVYADRDGESAIASLIGEHGEAFPITTFPFVVGRGSECDLVLQGKGISRRHAEIIFQSGRFVVNDLESLNGIKVNGYKVSRVILEENDNVRLGEVALIFKSSASAGEAVNKPSVDVTKNKRLSGLFQKKPMDIPVSSADDTFGSSPAKKLVTNTIVLVAAVLVGLVGYRFWIGQNQQSGRIVEAPTAQPTTAPSAAQVVAEQARPPVPAQSSEQPGTVAVPAPEVLDPDAVVQSSSLSVEPPLSISPPPSIAKKNADSAPRTPPVKAITLPSPDHKPVVAKQIVQTSIVSSDKGRAVLSKSQELYFKGDADSAIATLKPLLDDPALPAALRAEVKGRYSTYTSLYNQYGAGQSSYARGDKESAFQAWVTFMDKEAALFNGRKSAYTQAISARVVGEYVSLGNEAAKSGDHHKAYRMWQKALDLGDNVAARIAIDNANNRAMQLYRQALRLEYVNTSKAKALWQEVTQLLPVGTEYNTKASAKLAWYEKWGT